MDLEHSINRTDLFCDGKVVSPALASHIFTTKTALINAFCVKEDSLYIYNDKIGIYVDVPKIQVIAGLRNVYFDLSLGDKLSKKFLTDLYWFITIEKFQKEF